MKVDPGIGAGPGKENAGGGRIRAPLSVRVVEVEIVEPVDRVPGRQRLVPFEPVVEVVQAADHVVELEGAEDRTTVV